MLDRARVSLEAPRPLRGVTGIQIEWGGVFTHRLVLYIRVHIYVILPESAVISQQPRLQQCPDLTTQNHDDYRTHSLLMRRLYPYRFVNLQITNTIANAAHISTTRSPPRPTRPSACTRLRPSLTQ